MAGELQGSKVHEIMYASLLGEYGPRTMAGYRRLRDVVDEDRALPAWFKSLAVACAAASKGYPDLVKFQIRTGHVRGLTLEQCMGGVITLTSARGAGAAMMLLDVVADIYNARNEHLDDAPPVEVATGEAEGNFRSYMGGELHPNFAALLEASQELADAYYLLRTGTLNHNRLESKLAELLLSPCWRPTTRRRCRSTWAAPAGRARQMPRSSKPSPAPSRSAASPAWSPAFPRWSR